MISVFRIALVVTDVLERVKGRRSNYARGDETCGLIYRLLLSFYHGRIHLRNRRRSQYSSCILIMLGCRSDH
jgi:hypothetical protein